MPGLGRDRFYAKVQVLDRTHGSRENLRLAWLVPRSREILEDQISPIDLSPSLILSGDPRVFAGITKRTSLHPDLISTWFAAPRRFIAHIPVGTTPAYGLFWYVVCFGVDLVILFYLIYLICLIHGLTNASKCRSITTDDLGFRRIDSSRLPGIGGAKREMPLAGAWPCDSFDSWSSRGCDHSHWQSGRQPHYEFLFVNALIRELVRHAASIVT